jgi:hypothetical protein
VINPHGLPVPTTKVEFATKPALAAVMIGRALDAEGAGAVGSRR